MSHKCLHVCVCVSVHKCVHWLVNLYGVPAVVYKSFWNSLSTFCYLAAQRNLLAEFVDGRLAAEVGLLGGGAHAAHQHDHHHAGDEEDADAVDGDLHVVRREGRGRALLDGYREVEEVK